jgi:hypothetical protein
LSQLFNSAGNHTNNYTYVNQTSSDGDSTYVGTDSTSAQTDTYTVPATSDLGTISNVQVCNVTRDISGGLGYDTRNVLRIGSTNYVNAVTSSVSAYTTVCDNWAANPNNNQPWTWSAVNAAEIGVQLDTTISASLPGDALISTPQGLRRIADIQAGDQVYSYDGTHTVVGTVRQSFTHEGTARRHYILNGALRTTGNHMIYTERGYVRADEVTTGDSILSRDNVWVPVSTIETLESSEPVYDLSVNDYHNFYADGYLVHNVNDTVRTTQVYAVVSYYPVPASLFAVDTSGNGVFAGSLSVGTTTGYSRFSVLGTGTGSNQLFELTNGASTTVARFLDNGTGYFNGNIGIGVASPNERLQVAGGNIGTYGSGNGFVIYNVGQGNYSGNYEMARFMPVSNEFLFQTLQGGTGVGRNMRFAVGNANLTLVNSSGNVGIGTTVPADKLDIAGNQVFHSDNTYDIGQSDAYRPRNVYIAGNTVIGGQTTLATSLTGLLYGVSGVVTASSSLSFDTTNGQIVSGGAGLAGALQLKPANTAYNWYTMRNADVGAGEGIIFGRGVYPTQLDLAKIDANGLVTSLGAGAGFRAFNTGVAGATYGLNGINSFYTGHNLTVGGSGTLGFQTYAGAWLTRLLVQNDGTVTVGTTTAHATAGMTLANGDLYVAATSTNAVMGVVLPASDGTCHRLTISPTNVISATTVTCP